MSVPIPHYLKDIAVLEKQKDTWVHFSLKCTCGNDHFFIYENYLNKEEKALEKPHYDALAEIYDGNIPTARTWDENGKRHDWRLLEPLKGLEGAREEIIVPERPYFSGITVISVKCTACGKEHLIFDCRIHGYDGMTTEVTKETEEYVPHLRLKCKDIVSLTLKIENSESFEEFTKDCDLGFTPEQYSNAFSWLMIYKIDKKGKKTKIFDLETA